VYSPVLYVGKPMEDGALASITFLRIGDRRLQGTSSAAQAKVDSDRAT
jgi:hypothetical protein